MKRFYLLTLISLLLITACSAPTAQDPVTVPVEEIPITTPAEPTPPGQEPGDKLALSLKDAGLSETEVEILLDHQVSEGPREVTLVKFRRGETVYFYKYLADQLLTKKSYRSNQALPAEAEDNGISQAQAKQIALDRAGLSEADIHDYEIEIDIEDEKLIYEIEFESGDKEYEFDIDFYSGEILKQDIDD